MKYHQTFYTPKNPDKYIGPKIPYVRSSWEMKVCLLCDSNPNIIAWASEPCSIPYYNPVLQKQTVYIPDFLVVYVDRNGNKHSELIEIKPKIQMIENAKRKQDKLAAIVNEAKWDAARKFCAKRGLVFRVATEDHIFNKPKSKK